MLPVIGPLRPWTDPSLVQLNRLPMHVPLPVDRGARRSLDGTWNLRLFDHPDEVSADAVIGPTPSASTGHMVAVPGNWTMQDVGDLPHYTNVQMPFPGPPPALPPHNPTGVYRRTFEVGRGWRGRQVVLHIGGAESVHAVYLNDAFVGYGTDSRLPSEYDITDHLCPGRNHLTIVVVRYSAQSYVEDQDHWWMAGLHRSVFVEARPRVHLADVRCHADLRVEDGTGLLDVTTEVGFIDGAAPGWSVRSWLETATGRRIGAVHHEAVPHRLDRPYTFRGHVVTARWEVRRAAAWSAESPTRHRVAIELVAPDGTVAQQTHQWVGFRHVEVRDRQLLVNGQPIWIFGVNRHDHHPDRGKALTAADLRADLEVMRRHNITAIRTSHYPNDSVFYDLCDELGMYVIDEANIESHAHYASLCDDERYRVTWLQRGTRMVQRDRNHPSIIAWSLGNESGYGSNHDALAGWMRRDDPSRVLHYEGAIARDGWVDGGLAATDLVCPMYAPIEAIEAYGVAGRGTRPLILCEYSHAMGNSNGSLAEYWDVITTTPGLQGGFIWEWKDHGLRQRQPDGSQRLAYGGQFGDDPHDGNFVADGLVSSDRDPHPALQEVAWAYRPVTVALARRGVLRVTNRQSFVGLQAFRAHWELRVGGALIRSGRWRLPSVAPRAFVDVPLPCPIPDGTEEVHLTVCINQRAATWFAGAGHLVAWDQIELRRAPRPRRPRRVPADAALVPADVDRLLLAPIELSIFRAPVDNDGFKLMPELSRRIGVGGQALRHWQDAGVDVRPADELVGHVPSRTVEPDGSALYRHVVEVPGELADLPRVGVVFGLPARFSRLRWFGRGPGENYPDRCAGAPLGIWEGSPDLPPYLVPQEFGLRTECRWFELIDPDAGEIVRIDAVFPHALHISATHFTAADLYAATTESELRPREELIVHVDVAHRGLGTASCGPDVRDHHRLPAGRYDFAYRVSVTRV